MKNRRVIKVFIIFFAAILFFTFFSRTIFAFFTPTVMVQRPSFGQTAEEAGLLMIPATALIDKNFVYLLLKKPGFGSDKLFVQKQAIVIAFNDGRCVGVSSGLTQESAVIVDWDRPLYDGQRVLLPLN